MDLTPAKSREVSCPSDRGISGKFLECRVPGRPGVSDSRYVSGGNHRSFCLEESLMDEKGRLRLGDAGLIAYSHGSYVALQHKELGTFGYSVMKPKTRRRIAAQKRQDNQCAKGKTR